MAKFYGPVGFIETVKENGVSKEVPKESFYTGDVVRRIRRIINGEYLNDNIDVSNEISIVADPYAINHFFNIKYVEWSGARWEVTSVDVKYPKLKLTIGGLYNGERPQT